MTDDAPDPTPLIERELFRSSNLLVRAATRAGDAIAYVTFDSYSDAPELDRPGFGEAYFRPRGVSAVYIVARENRWYQHPELPDALAAAAAAVAGVPTVVAYGSSMGGFAALRYGSAAGATRGLALSPQFSLRPGDPPGDRRWAADVAQIAFQPFAAAALPIQHILYDPFDAFDRAHAELFAAASPSVLIPIGYAGHPVGSYVREVGLFDLLFAGVAAGTLTGQAARDFVAELRRRRRGSGQYHFTLATRAWQRHLDWGIRLAERAAAILPADGSYQSFLGFLLDKAGRHEEAAERHARALAGADSTIHTRIRHILHHAERDDRPTAAAALAALRADFPDNPQVRICEAAVRRCARRIRLARVLGALGLVRVADRLTRGRMRRLLGRYGGYRPPDGATRA